MWVRGERRSGGEVAGTGKGCGSNAGDERVRSSESSLGAGEAVGLSPGDVRSRLSTAAGVASTVRSCDFAAASDWE